MKQKWIILFISSILLSLFLISCLTLPNTSRLRWSLGQFVDQWNQPTGKYFVRFDGTVVAMFFSGGGRQEEKNIRDITFSEAEGLTFFIPSATGSGPIMSMSVDIIIIKLDGTEAHFQGFYGGPARSRVRIEYSDELKELLLLEEVTIRLLMSNDFFRYQFKFPENFRQAYELLID